jgi:hypothetical protein
MSRTGQPRTPFRAITVPRENAKFNSSSMANYMSLNREECDDLHASIEAVRRLMENGPKYDYTTFRGGTNGRGTVIGGSRFGYGNTF